MVRHDGGDAYSGTTLLTQPRCWHLPQEAPRKIYSHHRSYQRAPTLGHTSMRRHPPLTHAQPHSPLPTWLWDPQSNRDAGLKRECPLGSSSFLAPTGWASFSRTNNASQGGPGVYTWEAMHQGVWLWLQSSWSFQPTVSNKDVILNTFVGFLHQCFIKNLMGKKSHDNLRIEIKLPTDLLKIASNLF